MPKLTQKEKHNIDSKVPDWNKIVQSIEDGEVILILGPKAIPLYQIDKSIEEIKENQDSIEDKQLEKKGKEGTNFKSVEEFTLQKIIRHAIEKDEKIIVNHFYERDHLYQFKDARSKLAAMKCVRNVIRDESWIPDSELLKQIVSIPFSVVLNLNPDKFVFDTFAKYSTPPQFDYYTTKGKSEFKELEYPDSKENPLIYNLCGSSLDKRDSIILDYYDLFELLKNLLMDNGVPSPLTTKLQEADKFILLGCELEHWYFQLFLHYLNKLDDNPFNNSNENFPIICQVNEDTQNFMMNQFNVEYISSTRSDFEKIYYACQKKGKLRDLSIVENEKTITVKKLIANGKMMEAFDFLNQQINNEDFVNTITILKARYNQYKFQSSKKLEDEKSLNIELNKIRYALLSIADTI